MSDGKKTTRSNRRNADRSTPSGTRPIGTNDSPNQYRVGCSWRGLVCVLPYLTYGHALAQSSYQIKRHDILRGHRRTNLVPGNGLLTLHHHV
jgi:hypothetical protein